MIMDIWHNLSVLTQDIVILILLLAPGVLAGGWVLRGFAPWPLLRALLRQNLWVSVTCTALIAISVAIGAGLTAQERGLRVGSAQAADPFDMIVTAPGSEITAMFAAVFLQVTDMPLLDGELYIEIATHERVAFAAPIAFGDSYQSAPVVGTTPQFLTHMAPDLAAGRAFETVQEAVIGARVPLAIGDTFEPAHGVGDTAQVGAHKGLEFLVTGQMPPTGSPWDKAILIPVEAVWEAHGLASGHPFEWDGTIGPPFTPEFFPGTPAILVRAEALWANYALRSEFSTTDSMAFFPGAVLARLHGLMGDVRQVMSLLAVMTQVLVAAGSLTALMILSRLLSGRFAVLRAIGAPVRFIFALMWGYAAVLILAGAVLGLILGFASSAALSAMITARTDILVWASLSWTEFHLVAGFVSLTLLLALIPAALTTRRSVVADLRQ